MQSLSEYRDTETAKSKERQTSNDEKDVFESDGKGVKHVSMTA